MSIKETQTGNRNQRNSYFNFSEWENTFLTWVSDIVNRRKGGQFRQEDHLSLKPEHSSSNLSESFHTAWDEANGQQYRLLNAFFISHKAEIKRNFIMQGIAGLLDFIVPLFVFIIVSFSESKFKSVVLGIFILFIMALMKAVSGLVIANARTQAKIIGEKLSSCTVSLIYNKLLKIPVFGNNDFNPNEVFKFIEKDAIKIRAVVEIFGSMIVLPIKFFFGIIMIYWMIGAYMIPMFFILGGILWLNTRVSGKFATIKEEIQAAREKRVKLTEEILAGIRYIKMSGFENIFAKKIFEKRNNELFSVKINAYGLCYMVFSAWLTPILMGIIVFGLYALAGNVVTAKIAFIILASYEIIADFLENFPDTYRKYLDIKTSSDKIQKFLGSREIDTRTYITSGPANTRTAIKIVEGNFKWTYEDGLKNYALPSESSRHQETEMEFIDSERKEFWLKNINLEIAKGEFIIIIGEAASGKSSLLYAILGELYPRKNAIEKFEINGSVAYIGEKCWILNASIRKNIILEEEFNETLFEEALNQSTFKEELYNMPHSDATGVGEGGIFLNETQRVKLSLARAIYSKRPIVIMDDPLKYFDQAASRFILEECFINAMAQRTRIMVTHTIEAAYFADRTLIMSGGEISEVLTHDQLEKSTAFTELAKVHGNILEPDMVEMNPNTSFLNNRSCDLNVSREELFNEFRGKPKWNKRYLMADEDKEFDLIGKQSHKHFFRYFGGRAFIGIVAGIMLTWSYFRVFSNIALADWTQDFKAHESGNWSNFSAYSLKGIFAAIVIGIQMVYMVLKTNRASEQIHNDMLLSVLYAPINYFFDRVPIMRLINRFNRDLSMVTDELGLEFAFSVIPFFSILQNFAICLYVGSLWIMPIFILSLYLSGYLHTKTLGLKSEIRRLARITRNPVNFHFNEGWNGLIQIRSYQKQNALKQDLHTKQDELMKNYILESALSGWLLIRINLASLIAMFPTMLFAIIYMDEIPTGLMALLVMNVFSLDKDVLRFLNELEKFETSLVSFERCREYTQIAPEQVEPKIPIDLPNNWPNAGEIEYQDYTTRYRDDLPFALQDVSVKINSGEKICVAGRSGAGKSSILYSILRIIEPLDGKILIDGVSVERINLETLRKQITVVPQETFVFSGTVRDNVDLNGIYTGDEISKILTDVGLEYRLNEGGLDYELNVDKMSLAEKQMICAARALLMKRKIILIDEATNFLDANSEDKILQLFKDKFRDCTTITIAHRIKTIFESDRVIVLDKGKVLQFDTPQKLAAERASELSILMNEYENKHPSRSSL